MKARFSLLILVLATFLYSCTENDNTANDTGDIQFSASELLSATGRTQAGARAVLITVKRADGEIVHNRTRLALYQFGDQFISEPISLRTGNYQLTEFLVLGENDEVIYATPLAGSELAHLVENPLPYDFTITKDTTIKVVPEVLSVESYEPEDFGYATFAFEPVETFTFSVAVFAYSEQTENLELTSATISIVGDESFNYTKELQAITNHLRVRDGLSNYEITVSKPGYGTHAVTYLASELKAFTGENILKIVLLEGDSTVNRAIAFDGDYDFIDLGDVYNDAQLPMTISTWVWLSSPDHLYNPVFTSQDLDDIYNGISFTVNDTHIGVTYGDGRGQNHYMYRRSKAAAHNNVVYQGWVHVAAVIRGADDMDIYLNGVDIGGDYYGGSPFPMVSDSPGPARIGSATSNGIVAHYKGLMDELNLWNRALSAQEIADLRSKKLTGTEAGLIGYWSFDEAEGVTVFDKSSSQYNGIMGGDAYRVISANPALH